MVELGLSYCSCYYKQARSYYLLEYGFDLDLNKKQTISIGQEKKAQ